MAVKTDIAGIGSNITQYSAEAAVPSLNPADLDGGTGSIKFTTGPLTYPQVNRNRQFVLTDTQFGSAAGRISQVSWGSKNAVEFTAETMLQRLNIEATIYPSYGLSLTDAMDQVLSLAGMSSSGLPTTGTVVFPGWRGVILDYLKHFCTVYDYEYYVDSGTPDVIKFRTIRTQPASPKFSSRTYSVNDQTSAQSVSANMYEYTIPSSGYLEFAPFSVDDPQILTVDAGEVVQYDIKCNGWLSAVNQPVPMDLVGPEERTDTGAYCVAGNDGLPIVAAQWVDQGGSIRVEISDDPSVLHVTITAPDVESLPNTSGGTTLAPYSIAATAVDENAFYNSLHITGYGVRYVKTTQTFVTGVEGTVSKEENATTVENPFVDTTERLWTVGVRAAQAFAGPTHSVSAEAIQNNAFSDLLGSRHTGEGAIFRISSVTMSPTGYSLSGTADTLVSEFNTAWSGKTITDFNTLWAGQTCGVFATLPTRTA